MRTSEQINELADALAKAQGAIEGAIKGNVNPAFRSKYADLGAVWDAIREPLSAAGIAVVQGLESSAEGVICTTKLVHKSGQWIESVFAVPVGKKDAQGYGSAATYCRRYSLMAMVGIAPVDDDGNEAVKSAPQTRQEAPQQPDPFTHDPTIVGSLKAAQTLDELQATWKAIPANVRARYTDLKDAAKDRITEAVSA